MIRRMQRKIILVTMAALLVVMTLVVASIILISGLRSTSEADQLLDLLAANNGQLPPAQNEDQPWNGLPSLQIDITPETTYEMRYFYLRIDQTGMIKQINMDKIVMVSRNQAETMAQEVLSSVVPRGYLDNYRFLVREQDDGQLVIFLDRRSTLGRQQALLIISILVGMGSMALVLVLVALFSKAVIRPVIDSITKQKRFITDAGHELKTPLAILSVNTEIVEMQNGKSEWTDSIQRQITRMNDLIHQLLALARMDEQQTEVHLTDLDFSELLKACVHEYTTLAKARGKILTAEIEPNLHIRGEASGIQQLMSILLDNAVNHSDEHGQITCSLKTDHKQARWQISNSCESIDPMTLEHLFDRFYRADSSRARSSGGYGLGLSIAHNIVENHRGKIAAESKDRLTITITVTLPLMR